VETSGSGGHFLDVRLFFAKEAVFQRHHLATARANSGSGATVTIAFLREEDESVSGMGVRGADRPCAPIPPGKLPFSPGITPATSSIGCRALITAPAAAPMAYASQLTSLAPALQSP